MDVDALFLAREEEQPILVRLEGLFRAHAPNRLVPERRSYDSRKRCDGSIEFCVSHNLEPKPYGLPTYFVGQTSLT